MSTCLPKWTEMATNVLCPQMTLLHKKWWWWGGEWPTIAPTMTVSLASRASLFFWTWLLPRICRIWWIWLYIYNYNQCSCQGCCLSGCKLQGSALTPPWPEENTIQLCRTLDIVKEMNMNIYLESNFLDEFGVGDEYDGQRNSEAKGVDEDYVPGMCEYINMCE